MTELKRVTLYRIKPGVEFEDFLKGGLATFDHFERNEDGFEAYIKYANAGGAEKTEALVPWLKFLNSEFEGARYTFVAHNRFPRAAMALRIRISENDLVHYIATFGQHGDVFFDKIHIAYDFGIKVGMNICDMDRLRRVQTTAHEAISKQTERQASVGTNLGVFGINTEAEFLRTISAHVKADFAGIIESFKGRDSISIKLPRDTVLNWPGMAQICRRLEERYRSDDYRNTEFKVYDVLRNEHDPAVIDRLDDLLCKKIETKDFEKIHLAPPEFVEMEDVSYCFQSRDDDDDEDDAFPLYEDLAIGDLVGLPRRRLKNLTTGTLRSWKIFRFDSDQGKTFPLWNAYQCLVAEIDDGERTYVLSNGQWREVSEELKDKVSQYFDENDMEVDAHYLPQNVRIYDIERGQDREDVYNGHVAANEAGAFLFDKAKIDIAGKRLYEICDILHADGHLVHVKRYTSGSASISHIFTQTKLYSEAFATDTATRASIVEWLDASDLPLNAGKDKNVFRALIPQHSRDVVEANYSIVFCLLHSSDNFDVKSLPFMAQYELMLSHRYLTQNRKFNVGVVFRKVLVGPEAVA